MANSRDLNWPTRLAEAQTVVQTHLDRTPLVRVDLGSFDPPTYLKLESLQPTGSFKVRGALAAVAIIAGQATVVGEVAEQVVGPFRIVVPVGGGGLAAGTALGAPARASVMASRRRRRAPCPRP
jgi:threonine dehydratase